MPTASSGCPSGCRGTNPTETGMRPMTELEAQRPIRVVLVDDDPVVRTGLRFMLGVAADLEVVAEVSDGDEVVGAIQAHRPDVVVLDVRMARVGGIEAIAAIKARPEAP